jgi:N6-adenosine-specific RNA methylase IME4
MLTESEPAVPIKWRVKHEPAKTVYTIRCSHANETLTYPLGAPIHPDDADRFARADERRDVPEHWALWGSTEDGGWVQSTHDTKDEARAALRANRLAPREPPPPFIITIPSNIETETMQTPIAANDTFTIDPEFAELIPALSPDEYKQLEANIVREGCHEPLSIWDNDGKHVLIDGHNRHNICTTNGKPFTTNLLKFENRDEVKIWICDRQLGRRNLTDDQRSAVGANKQEIVSALAQSNAATLREKEKRTPSLVKTPKLANPTNTRRAVAADMNISERKLRSAIQIKKAAPAVHELVHAGKVSLAEGKKLANLPIAARKTAISAVLKGDDFKQSVRAAKRDDYNDRIAITKPKALEGTYRIIYADPPWKYVGLNGNDDHGHAEAHYDCLDDEQLKAYRPGNGDRLVKDIADKNAVLFMWVTSPMFVRCVPIIEAWGFEYKSSFVWDKVGHNMGHYNSVRHELLLICTKGSCKPDVPKLFDSVQSIERTKHSQKPHEFYEIIEGLYDHGRKLELFSRNKRDGWDMDGNEQEALAA